MTNIDRQKAEQPMRTPYPTTVSAQTLKHLLVILALLWLPLQARAQTASESDNRKPISALYLPAADHYAGIVAYEKYRDVMKKADYSIKRMPGWPILRAEFLSNNADVAFIVAPLAMDMFAKNPAFRWVSLMHRDGNALAINDLLNSKVQLTPDRRNRRPDHSVADAFAAARSTLGKPIECGVPSLLATHTVILYKYLKDHGKTLSLGATHSADIIAITVSPAESPKFIKIQNSRGKPASFEQSLPWADVVETGHFGHVAWYSKDVLPWPEGHVECIAIAQDTTISGKSEALQEVIYYIHMAGQDIEEAREKGGESLDEIARMVRKHIPEHSVEAIHQSLRLDLDVINYRHMNVDEGGLRQIMDLALEGGILKQPIDISAFANHDYATEITLQRSRPKQARSPQSESTPSPATPTAAAGETESDGAITNQTNPETWSWVVVLGLGLLLLVTLIVLVRGQRKHDKSATGRAAGSPGGRLANSLVLWFLLLSLVPLLAVTAVSYRTASQNLTDDATQMLTSVAHLKTEQLMVLFESMLTDIDTDAQDPANIEFIQALVKAFNESGEPLTKFVTSPVYESLLILRGKPLVKRRRTQGYYDILLTDALGNVLFSVARENDLGTNLLRGDNAENHLGKACSRALSTGQVTFSDFNKYGPSQDEYAGFLIAPIVNSNGKKTGLLIYQIANDKIDNLVRIDINLGDTGETYLLGEDMSLRSTVTTTDGETPPGTKITSSVTENWAKHLSETKDIVCTVGVQAYPGHWGRDVLGAHKHLQFAGVQYLLVAELDESDALAAARRLLLTVLVLLMGTGLCIVLVGFTISRRIVDPVLQVSQAARQVADGNLEVSVEVTATNEIGELGRALNRMTSSLHKAALETTNNQWLKTGQTQILEAMRGTNDLSVMSRQVITELAQFIGAQIGLLYIRENNDIFRLKGSFGCQPTKDTYLRFTTGEGLAGQSVLDRRPMHLPEIPEDYIRISSGSGDSLPRSLIIHPLIAKNEVQGVLELASFSSLTGLPEELLAIVAESIAIGITSVRGQEQVRTLLEESQSQAQELQSQQEELRVSNEELEEQAQRLKQSEGKLQAQQEEMTVTNEELEEKNRLLLKQKREVENAGIELTEKAEELALASKYKSEFLANMSHELRTPLNSLLLLAQWLGQNKEGNLTEEQIESAQVIHNSGNDLLNLINDILDLSKIESGRIEVHTDTIELEELSTGIRQAFSHMARDKGLAFVIEVEDGSPDMIISDRQRLEQIIKNLISNGIKFTDSGTITVTIGRMTEDARLTHCVIPQDKALAISVRDTGIGIEPKHQKMIFEAFQQADGGTSREYGGTGLGLSISRELSRLLGGEIQLVSKPGEGSVFTLYLPVDGVISRPDSASPEQRTPISRPSPTSIPRSTGTRKEASSVEPELPDDRNGIKASDWVILVIEDDHSFAGILLTICHERGFKCLVSSTGEAGLDLARSFLPGGILLDLGLPDMDGWSVLHSLKDDTTTRHIPVHIISAVNGSTEALSKGAIGHATKPVSEKDLADAFALLEQVAGQETRRVLLVEDDAHIRKSIKDLIGEGDVKVDEAATGAEALEAMQTNDYGCLILDLGLPDMSGSELLATLTKDGRKLPPVIVHTARDLTEEEVAKLREHAESIVIKDVRSQERLLDEVSLFLHRMVSKLPEPKKQMIRTLHDTDALLDGKIILIVDDDMRTSFALSRLLAERGIKPLKAANGLQALEMLDQENTIDLVLMDIMMPIMDGYETMQKIRSQEQFRELPIIALTAKAMPEDRQKCIDAGANDYMQKPVDPERLISLMRVWLYR
jgi:CheY-like chemotaxis protein/signal transduction histidine kinase/ABC-type nitrate/sulfonate/bicarbonate transport system substrate-binding protein/HAMP domain-containing protein